MSAPHRLIALCQLVNDIRCKRLEFAADISIIDLKCHAMYLIGIFARFQG